MGIYRFASHAFLQLRNHIIPSAPTRIRMPPIYPGTGNLAMVAKCIGSPKPCRLTWSSDSSLSIVCVSLAALAHSLLALGTMFAKPEPASLSVLKFRITSSCSPAASSGCHGSFVHSCEIDTGRAPLKKILAERTTARANATVAQFLLASARTCPRLEECSGRRSKTQKTT